MGQQFGSPGLGLMETLSPALAITGSQFGDMFLSVTSSRQGSLTGEASAPGYEGQMNISAWQWGLFVADAMSGKRGGVRGAKALSVIKNVDTATTKLMSALSKRENLKEVTLTMRRSGDHQVAFMQIKLTKALVVALDVQGRPDGGLIEQVAFQFESVEVVYAGQGSRGQNLPSTTYTDNFSLEPK